MEDLGGGLEVCYWSGHNSKMRTADESSEMRRANIAALWMICRRLLRVDIPPHWFLMSDMELLDMFGYNDESTITCGDRKSEFDDIRVKLDNVSQLNTTCTCSSVLLDFVL